MGKRIELLAPAGDFESLRAAVENGADAVYLGGRLFNARQNAGNFEPEQLKAALDYAHIRGVNIYLTMNTLISDQEMDQAVEFTREAYRMGIDGIIVQDAGFAGTIHRLLPELPLHASTQMTVHSLEGVKLLESLGFKRVVLARELTLDEISHIAANTSLEVEIFIHGALCICYSGQCLMSSIIGGRSGNRGKCAQPCRLPYRLVYEENEEGTGVGNAGRYLLSPKDLCTLEMLEGIASSGVKSLKIEGRMKSPEYVATVVGVYRKHLDLIRQGDTETARNALTGDMHDLNQIFNRGGFTGGYFSGNPGRDLMSFEKPKNWGTYLGETVNFDRAGGMVKIRLAGPLAIGDGIEIWNGKDESPGTIVTMIKVGGANVKEAVKGQMVEAGNIKGDIFKGCKVYKTSDKQLLAKARESFEGKPHRRIKLAGTAVLKRGEALLFKVSDEDGNEAAAESDVVSQDALNRPLTQEKLMEQLGKTGATPFELLTLEIELDGSLSLPVSEINETRRKALELLEQKRLQKYAGRRDEAGEPPPRFQHTTEEKRRNHPRASIDREPQIALYFYEWTSGMDYSSFGADRLYLPYKALLKPEGIQALRVCKDKGIEVFIWLPSILRGNVYRLIREKIAENCGDGLLAGNPGVLQMLPGTKDFRLMGDYSFNVFNSHTALLYETLGFEEITLSPELTLGQMCGILRNFDGRAESIVYGRVPLMTSEYCPAGSVKGGFSRRSECKGSCSGGSFRLKDRLGVEFPVICDRIDCRSMILNSNVLFIPEDLKKLGDAGAASLRLYISDESPRMIGDLVRLHRDCVRSGDTAKHAGLIAEIKARGFTKGHFYKGV